MAEKKNSHLALVAVDILGLYVLGDEASLSEFVNKAGADKTLELLGAASVIVVEMLADRLHVTREDAMEYIYEAVAVATEDPEAYLSQRRNAPRSDP